MATRVHVIDSVEDKHGDWTLCFQYCVYDYGDNTKDYGYRFIWKKPDGKLQAARGQARIPDIDTITRLIEKAKRLGWAYKGGDTKTI
ncbi:hypothetical protein [Providencia stuartii]|uniref:hypothetical protein n=1 Tax=Providencia stuartii TaxID=588 RepID=UPI0038059925